ncbi:MAG: hypothetical protein MK207_00860 [Saprospiraceae bacterium]|nr:hypothetical protein [Saprospiraceae bacterium]
MATKAEKIKQAQAKIKELEVWKNQQLAEAEAEQICIDTSAVDKEIQYWKSEISKLTSAADLVSSRPKPTIKSSEASSQESTPMSRIADQIEKDVIDNANELLNPIDKFIKKHGNYKWEQKVSSPAFPVASCGVGSITLKASAGVKAQLKSKRKSNVVTCTGSVSGSASVTLTAQVGFSVAGVGASIGLGIRGAAAIKGSATTTLTATPNSLTGAIGAKMDFTASLALVASVSPHPSPVEYCLKLAAAGIGNGVSASGGSLTYPLGSLTIITANTPKYSITFNAANSDLSFGTRVSGSFDASLHPSIKSKIDYLYGQLKYYANQVNPVKLTTDAVDYWGDKGVVGGTTEFVDELGDYLGWW